MLIPIKLRIRELENASGINKFNIAYELDKLKKQVLEPQTIDDLEKLITECEDNEILNLYRVALQIEMDASNISEKLCEKNIYC